MLQVSSQPTARSSTMQSTRGQRQGSPTGLPMSARAIPVAMTSSHHTMQHQASLHSLRSEAAVPYVRPPYILLR